MRQKQDCDPDGKQFAKRIHGVSKRVLTVMHQDRNTLLKIHSTGEYIAWNQFDGFHLTMNRREACPFTEDEIKLQEGKWNQKIVRAGIWIIPLWKKKK